MHVYYVVTYSINIMMQKIYSYKNGIVRDQRLIKKYIFMQASYRDTYVAKLLMKTSLR